MSQTVAALVVLFGSAALTYPQCPGVTVTNFAIAGQPRGVIARDFNRDGIVDLVVLAMTNEAKVLPNWESNNVMALVAYCAIPRRRAVRH